MSALSVYDVVVLGAGLSGLTAAYELQKARYKVAMIEAKGQVGGVIHSEKTQGFLVEAGPNTFPSSSAAVQQLCRELALCPIPAASLAKKRYLYLDGKLQALPNGPLAFLKSPILSLKGKLRLLTEPWQPRGTKTDETVADFTRRRLGPEALDKLMTPFLSGVYAGDPEQTSLPAVFPKMAEWERKAGSLVKGALQEKQSEKRKSKVPYQLLSFEAGMATLPQALAGQLPSDSLRLSTTLKTIEKNGDSYTLTLSTGEALSTKAVLFATPAPQTAQWLHNVSPQASQLLSEIPYAPMGVIHLGFPLEAIQHPLDGFGCLIPRSEKLPLLGCIWTSSLFPSRAPQGQILLTCFLGGALHPETKEWRDEKMIEQTLTDLRHIFKNKDLTPTFHKLYRYTQALPQYTLGHITRIQNIQDSLKHQPGLFFTGNYRQGASLNDSIQAGVQASKEIQICITPSITK